MPQPCPNTAQSAERDLLDRIANDRLAEGQLSHGGDPVTEPVYRRAFNDGSRHVEHLVRLFLTEQRLMAACDDLRDAPALDLRVKYALILGAAADGTGTHPPGANRNAVGGKSVADVASAPPVASQDTGTFHPPQIDAAPHGVSAGATPPAREVGGGPLTRD